MIFIDRLSPNGINLVFEWVFSKKPNNYWKLILKSQIFVPLNTNLSQIGFLKNDISLVLPPPPRSGAVRADLWDLPSRTSCRRHESGHGVQLGRQLCTDAALPLDECKIYVINSQVIFGPKMGQINMKFDFSDQKWTEIWSEKVPDLFNFGLIWPTLVSNLAILTMNLTNRNENYDLTNTVILTMRMT